ncbi:MAG TPA: hypothetical protein VF595_11290 [Tepidisphaeraceae bacterium]
MTHLSPARQDRVPLLIAVVLYAALSAWMAAASPYFLEADGITHFLSRRFAINQPLHFVSVWSRPLCVALYCLPAKFGGLLGTRLTSLALVLLTVPLVIASARRLGLKRPAWAGLFLLTQPLLFAHSFSELTEVPFALLLGAIFFAYQCRAFGLMALLVAISPLGRPEGFGLLLVAAVALVLHRKWVWLLVLPAGLLAWAWIGWHVFGGPKEYPWWRWLGQNWPYSPESVYGHGGWLTFVQVLPAVIGPVGFGFAVFGTMAMLRHGPRPFGSLTRFFASHRARCRALVWAVPIGVLVVHSLLWVTGKMASNGEPRYLLVAAPFWAILAASGLERLTRRFNWRRPLLCVAVGAALPFVANGVYPVFPLGPQNDDRLAERVSAWLDENKSLRVQYPRLLAWSPHLFFRLDVDKLNKSIAGQPTRAEAKTAPAGSLLVWDSVYSVFNSSSEYVVTQELLRDSGWKPIKSFTIDENLPSAHSIEVYVSPQDVSGQSVLPVE